MDARSLQSEPSGQSADMGMEDCGLGEKVQIRNEVSESVMK